jgi:uncharacterized protein YbjT (DUF2867 family)
VPQGVEIQVGDLEKPWTLGPAFVGADTVWILAPPGPRAPEQCSNALWTARQGGATRVVRMSAFGAAHVVLAIVFVPVLAFVRYLEAAGNQKTPSAMPEAIASPSSSQRPMSSSVTPWRAMSGSATRFQP